MLVQHRAMKLAALESIFTDIEWKFADQVKSQIIANVCFDSRKLSSGCIFVAIRGTKVDGHDFIAHAVEKGALALVVEGGGIPENFRGAVVRVQNSREALNKIAALFYSHPSQQLFCMGVTGTNGKTTITHMLEAILNSSQKPVGVIGTIDHHLSTPKKDHVWKTELTTPDPIEFQHRLREFVELGAKAVALEVSSIGLRQNRVDEVEFDVAIFTNLTRDHLDFHSDMEDYFLAKQRLFSELLVQSPKSRRWALINQDDPYGARLVSETKKVLELTVWTYGQLKKSSDQTEELNDYSNKILFRILAQGFFGTKFILYTPCGTREFCIHMTGLHNVYNASAAVGAALAAGVSLDTAAAAMETLHGVKGRLEAVPNKQGIFVFVDYAHTDDALATVLHYLNQIRIEANLTNKIITVFGCGGDRDKGKRPLMMKAAESKSDVIFVTSDNPRTENPDEIIKNIMAGASAGVLGKNLFAVSDRKSAIAKALATAEKGDVVLIAGKGHEDYQIIGTTKYPFSDVAVVQEILK